MTIVQAPLSIEFSKQEYWTDVPFSSPGNLPDPGDRPTFSVLIGIGRQTLYHSATRETLIRT